MSNKELNKLFRENSGIDLWVRIFLKAYSPETKTNKHNLTTLLLKASDIIIRKLSEGWEDRPLNMIETRISETRDDLDSESMGEEQAIEHFGYVRQLEASLSSLMGPPMSKEYYEKENDPSYDIGEDIYDYFTSDKVKKKVKRYSSLNDTILSETLLDDFIFYGACELGVLNNMKIKGLTTFARILGVDQTELKTWLDGGAFDYKEEIIDGELYYVFPFKEITKGKYLSLMMPESDLHSAIGVALKMWQVEQELPLVIPYLKFFMQCIHSEEITIHRTRINLIEINPEYEE